jgi:hypothetical protein
MSEIYTTCGYIRQEDMREILRLLLLYGAGSDLENFRPYPRTPPYQRQGPIEGITVSLMREDALWIKVSLLCYRRAVNRIARN